jgi:hypothetical protein
MKPIQAKPSLYSYIFYPLKEIAIKYGYNLVLHGSLNRDLDLIAIAWSEDIGNYYEMILEFNEYLGGNLLKQEEHQINCHPHGRKSYVINLNRGGYINNKYVEDQEYYIDISVIPIYLGSIPYLKIEYDQQIVRMKELGIDVEDQMFEQSVNSLLFISKQNNYPEELLCSCSKREVITTVIGLPDICYYCRKAIL